MQKNANLFHVAMTLYAFAFVTAIVFQFADQPSASPQNTFASGAAPVRPVIGAASAVTIKATNNPTGLADPEPENFDNKI